MRQHLPVILEFQKTEAGKSQVQAQLEQFGNLTILCVRIQEKKKKKSRLELQLCVKARVKSPLLKIKIIAYVILLALLLITTWLVLQPLFHLLLKAIEGITFEFSTTQTEALCMLNAHSLPLKCNSRYKTQFPVFCHRQDYTALDLPKPLIWPTESL